MLQIAPSKTKKNEYRLIQFDSTEIEMTDVNKAVSDSLKDIIVDAINKMRSIKKRPDNKAIFSFIITNSATNYEQEFIDSALNYMFRHNMIRNRPNSKDDSHFVNSENKLTDDMEKECNSDTENEFNVNPGRLSNIELEERSSSSSFNSLTPATSNQVVVNKYEDRFKQLDNRINSLEDLVIK